MALLLCTPAARAQGADDYGALVEVALEHFRSSRFREARGAFDRALPLAESEAERATLTFNAAVAAFEAGDYADAERRFLASARHDPATLGLCHVYAGLAALGSGAVERARAHLRSADPSDALAGAKRAELERALATAERERDLAAFRAALERGRRAHAAGSWPAARASLEAALPLRAVAMNAERATLFLLLGRVAHAQGRDAQARVYYEQAVQAEPSAADLRVALGDLAADRDEPALAEDHYAAASSLSRDARERDLIERRLEQLYLLPAPGPTLTVELSAGYDSNAAQSGAANAVGATGTSASSSAFGRLSLSLDWVFRSGRRSALAPFYGGTALELFDPDVSELSLQSHELGLSFFYAFNHRLVLRASPVAALFVVGRSEREAFSFEPGGILRLDALHGSAWSTRVSLDVRRIQGLNDRDALSGHRAELGLRETWKAGSSAVWVEGTAGENGMGVSLQTTSPDDFAVCSEILARGPPPECLGGNVYRIPLGYRHAAAALGASHEIFPALTLSGSLEVEGRRYLEDSVLVFEAMPSGEFGAPAEYRRRRQDLRWSAGARAAFDLDQARRYSVAASYSLLVSSSNVAQNEGGIEHRLDYDDRNFTQHMLELGVLGRF